MHIFSSIENDKAIQVSLNKDRTYMRLQLTHEQLVLAQRADDATLSPYHPESQGALERFHQTLKTMLKTYRYDMQ